MFSSQNICFTAHFSADLSKAIKKLAPDLVFVLTDTNTQKFCFPLVENALQNIDFKRITIPAGEENKTLQTLAEIWQTLSAGGATRQSLLVNLGGGVVTDMGGFAAATFKRGIRFLNLPTTLLAAVDAAAGGKTGINFGGIKNEIGAFACAEQTLVNTDFFRTQNAQNLLAGFAEMLKHALLSGGDLYSQTLHFDLEKFDFVELKPLLQKNIIFKQKIANEDFTELGIRKILNFGHTFAHAFESFFAQQNTPVLHGYAVAWGMVCELYLSLKKLNFPQTVFLKISRLIQEFYGKPALSCENYETICSFATHDKKNAANAICCTLLCDIGQSLVNQPITKSEIIESLDFLRDG